MVNYGSTLAIRNLITVLFAEAADIDKRNQAEEPGSPERKHFDRKSESLLRYAALWEAIGNEDGQPLAAKEAATILLREKRNDTVDGSTNSHLRATWDETFINLKRDLVRLNDSELHDPTHPPDAAASPRLPLK